MYQKCKKKTKCLLNVFSNFIFHTNSNNICVLMGPATISPGCFFSPYAKKKSFFFLQFFLTVLLAQVLAIILPTFLHYLPLNQLVS